MAETKRPSGDSCTIENCGLVNNLSASIGCAATVALRNKVKTRVKNENVLVSPSSHLVQVLISSHDTARFIITLDSENLLRAWDTISQETVYSYKLPL